jgi:hypothetical protein
MEERGEGCGRDMTIQDDQIDQPLEYERQVGKILMIQ